MLHDKQRIVFAIDPDVSKSGCAEYDLTQEGGGRLQLSALTFPQLLAKLETFKPMADDVLIAVEAGWLNRSNWHLTRWGSAAKAAQMGNAVGRNHETGRKIVEVCEAWGLNVKAVRPLPKHWKGKDRKITREELKMLTGYDGRSNQDERDAALLAWRMAGVNTISVNKISKNREK